MSHLTASFPDPQTIWQAYVGNAAPLEFLRQQGASSVGACVASYVDPLPRFEGIVRRANWTASFRAEFQLRPDEVIRGMLEHLEASRAEWESEWTGAPVHAAAPPQERPEPPAKEPDDEDETAEVPIEEEEAAEADPNDEAASTATEVPEVEAPPTPPAD